MVGTWGFNILFSLLLGMLGKTKPNPDKHKEKRKETKREKS